MKFYNEINFVIYNIYEICFFFDNIRLLFFFIFKWNLRVVRGLIFLNFLGKSFINKYIKKEKLYLRVL